MANSNEHQRAELASHLLANRSRARLRDGLKDVCAALEGMVAAEPPQQLRASILAALPAMAARPAAGPTGRALVRSRLAPRRRICRSGSSPELFCTRPG